MIPDRIMRKIERCIALSKSSNGNEAGIALRQAQALMAQYGVHHEDLALADFDVTTVDTHTGLKPPRYVELLAQLINRSFGTSTVYSSRREYSSSGRLKACGSYDFIGPKDAVQIAGYAYEVLQRQMIRDRRTFLNTLNKRLKRDTKVRRGDAFAEAWVAGAQNVVTPIKMAPEVIELHKKYRDRRYHNLSQLNARGHKPLKRHDYDAVSAGFKAGSEARLSDGIAATHREVLTHG
ncbi:DUF2786 domain-containing protein [Halomonas colorata]|uniref:DUF2786 domain-containing protein n=1 Tax=Halomonas colorata TaxID=2742615 RepID=UPI001868860B|nr:DUF2786 domain-containing protein [Halomonas colorata]